MSFQAKSDKVLNQQLKIQELVIRAADTHLYTDSGSDIVVDIGEEVTAVVAAIHLDNSAEVSSAGTGVKMVVAADISITGDDDNEITVTLAGLDANDVLILKYITA